MSKSCSFIGFPLNPEGVASKKEVADLWIPLSGDDDGKEGTIHVILGSKEEDQE